MAASSCRSDSGSAASSALSLLASARSVSDCELTDTYSPAAIDIAPATKPARPATKTGALSTDAAATPTSKLAVETMPSLAPSTAARSQPMRSRRCPSLCVLSRLIGFLGEFISVAGSYWTARKLIAALAVPKARRRERRRRFSALSDGSIRDLLPRLLHTGRQLVHVFQEQRNGPDLLVGQCTRPRWHPCPADAVFYSPERSAFGIVFDTLGGKLRRPGIEAGCHGRRRGVSGRSAVADCAMLPIQIEPGDKVRIS